MARLSWVTRGAATADRMRQRIARNGFTPNGHPLWDEREIRHLVEGYPRYDDIMPLIPRRSRTAAWRKASKLKITRPRPPDWSTNEIPRLRKVYPTGTREEILTNFPGRTYGAIAKAANSRGIYRAPKPYKPTGNTVLDQILQRARSRNWSLRELDLETRGRGYFSGRKWRFGRFNHRAHVKAVSCLGGALKLRWNDRAVKL